MIRADLLTKMASDGWEPVAPDAELAKVDEAVIARLACKACEGNLCYLPFTKLGNYRAFYRAFALCERCGESREF